MSFAAIIIFAIAAAVFHVVQAIPATQPSSTATTTTRIGHRQRMHHIRLKKQTGKFSALKKRLILYPNIGLLEERQQHQQNIQLPPFGLSSTASSSTNRTRGQQNQNGVRFRGNNKQKMRNRLLSSDQQKQQGESFQMCIFLRVGCKKINRSNHSQQLRDFVNRMLVQEKIQNGLIIHRKPSEQ
uniref:Uncharacterized protein n=1 Tax=Globodera rostochiensis TaxID=31243 RepID=A0A914GSC8_GLORO